MRSGLPSGSLCSQKECREARQNRDMRRQRAGSHPLVPEHKSVSLRKTVYGQTLLRGDRFTNVNQLAGQRAILFLPAAFEPRAGIRHLAHDGYRGLHLLIASRKQEAKPKLDVVVKTCCPSSFCYGLSHHQRGRLPTILKNVHSVLHVHIPLRHTQSVRSRQTGRVVTYW